MSKVQIHKQQTHTHTHTHTRARARTHARTHIDTQTPQGRGTEEKVFEKGNVFPESFEGTDWGGVTDRSGEFIPCCWNLVTNVGVYFSHFHAYDFTAPWNLQTFCKQNIVILIHNCYECIFVHWFITSFIHGYLPVSGTHRLHTPSCRFIFLIIYPWPSIIHSICTDIYRVPICWNVCSPFSLLSYMLEGNIFFTRWGKAKI